MRTPQNRTEKTQSSHVIPHFKQYPYPKKKKYNYKHLDFPI